MRFRFFWVGYSCINFVEDSMWMVLWKYYGIIFWWWSIFLVLSKVIFCCFWILLRKLLGEVFMFGWGICKLRLVLIGCLWKFVCLWCCLSFVFLEMVFCYWKFYGDGFVLLLLLNLVVVNIVIVLCWVFVRKKVKKFWCKVFLYFEGGGRVLFIFNYMLKFWVIISIMKLV